MSKNYQELESERLLIQRAQQDPQVFGEIFDEYYNTILNYIIRRTADVAVAQDLTSEVFLKALKNLHAFKWQGVPISAWLYRIATNELRMHYRRHRHSSSLEELQESQGFELVDERDFVAELQDAQDIIDRHNTFIAVQTRIATLPIKYQEVLALRFAEHKKISEIATILQKREGTVKSLISRGLKRLKSDTQAQETQPNRPRRIMDSEGRTIVKPRDEI